MLLLPRMRYNMSVRGSPDRGSAWQVVPARAVMPEVADARANAAARSLGVAVQAQRAGDAGEVLPCRAAEVGQR